MYAACMALAGPAVALEDPANGKRLAEQWCTSCHLVSSDQSEAVAGAPTFSAIAMKSDDELAALTGFLADPHPPMPNLNLTRDEIRDLVAYIRSLR